jgi:ABC-2 type transport system ATP-binding protein
MLEVVSLSHRYRAADGPALDAVSLSAQRGSILGLLGPNGAGKSTLVAHLAGLIPVRQGEIRVDGRPLAEARRQDPTRIAVAPQEFAFYPSLSVTENLACFAAASRLAGPAAREAVARCRALARLEDCAGVRAARLSGGQRRRLNLAIALLARPELVVLDEPTVGVDPESRAFLLSAVRGLAEAGAAVIYTSHYMEEIEAIADRIAILHRGRLRCSGTLDALLAGSPGRLELSFGIPVPPALVSRLAAFGTPEVDGARLALALGPDAALAQVMAAIEAAGTPVRELHWGRTRLEHLFLSLTGEDACSPP